MLMDLKLRMYHIASIPVEQQRIIYEETPYKRRDPENDETFVEEQI